MRDKIGFIFMGGRVTKAIREDLVKGMNRDRGSQAGGGGCWAEAICPESQGGT